ncbi:MAG: hypothetical protein COC09_00140 [Gammaproteobacteria bacterium]|nr:MAG: hypothetical protein COC09_00140 [Gammaproteobacteria bacterium]
MQEPSNVENGTNNTVQTTTVDLETVRKQLFDAVRNSPEAQQYFSEHRQDSAVLARLFDISLGDFPDSVRMKSCAYIAEYSAEMLQDYEEDLLDLQNEDWEWVSDNAIVALAKIKSPRGLKFLVEQRIVPKLKLEGEALSNHLAEILAKLP